MQRLRILESLLFLSSYSNKSLQQLPEVQFWILWIVKSEDEMLFLAITTVIIFNNIYTGSEFYDHTVVYKHRLFLEE